MAENSAIAGKWFKTGLAALGVAALAVPLASAFATAEDITEEAPVAAAELTAEQVEEGRALFSSWSCSACHVLTDAGGNGHIGPSLDGNAAMDTAFVANRITNGQGAMPGFGGQISDEEIDLLATYIMQAKK